MRVKVVTEKHLEVEEVVAKLKERSRVDIRGMAGTEVYVDKQLLSDAASVIETLAKTVMKLRTGEQSKEHTMCDDCGVQGNRHCDCTREHTFTPKGEKREFDTLEELFAYLAGVTE